MPHYTEIPPGTLLRVCKDDFWVWTDVKTDDVNSTYWLNNEMILDENDIIMFVSVAKRVQGSSIVIGRFLTRHGMMFTYMNKVLSCSFES